MDDPYDVDASLLCAEMQCSSPIRHKTDVAI